MSSDQLSQGVLVRKHAYLIADANTYVWINIKIVINSLTVKMMLMIPLQKFIRVQFRSMYLLVRNKFSKLKYTFDVRFM